MTQTATAKVLALAGFAAGYAVAMAVGYWFYVGGDAGSAFWPANGVYVAVLLLSPARTWPWVWVAAAATHAAIDCGWHGETTWTALGFFASNTAETTLIATIVRWRLGRTPEPTRLRDIALLCGIALLVTVGTALIGGSVFATARPVESVGSVVRIWWLADLLGVLTVGTAVLAWLRPSELGLWRGGPREFIGLVLSTTIIGAFSFIIERDDDARVIEQPVLLFPMLCWAAIRFGPRVTATGTVLVASLFVFDALHGEGTRPVTEMRQGGAALVDIVIWMQSGLVVGCAIALVLAAVMAERDRAEQANQRHRDEIARADKLVSLGTLVSSVAHELDNPNQLIMLNLPALEAIWDDAREVLDERHRAQPHLRIANSDWPRAREDAEKLLRDTAGAADRVRGFVAQLRDFGRAGVPQLRPFDLDGVVQDALTILGSRIRKATRGFELDLASELPRVVGDPRRIEQVVINLVLNACEALTDRAQSISIRTFARDDVVVLEVRDEGPGMSDEQIERITDPFFTTKPTGTGLGLAVTAQIVEDHGGRLRFKSEPGRGTTAEVSLPAAKDRDT